MKEKADKSGYLSFQYGIPEQQGSKTVHEMTKQTMPHATGLFVLLLDHVVTALSAVHSY